MASQVDFVKEFNKRLGQYTGNLAQAVPSQNLNMDLASRLSNIRDMQMQKLIEDRVKAMNRPGAKAVAPKTTAAPKVLGNLSQPTVDLITKSAANPQFMGVGLPHPTHLWGIPIPFLDKALGPIDNTVIGANIQAPLQVGRTALDILGRPAHAEFGALKGFWDAGNKGQDIPHSLDDVAKGFWAGLSGKNKTSFGNVVQSMAEATPESSGLRGQRNFNPFAGMERVKLLFKAQEAAGKGNVGTNLGIKGIDWSKRLGGAGGDVALDPTNVVGGKVVGTLREGDTLKTFTEDAYKKLAHDAADKAIADHGLTAKFNVRPALRRVAVDPATRAPIIDPATGLPKLEFGPVGKDLIHNTIDQSIEDSMIQTGGGATEGRLIGHKVAPFAAANNAGLAFREHLTRNFEDLRTAFENDLRAGKQWTSAQLAQARKTPFFSDYLDNLLAGVNKTRTANTYADIEALLKDYAKNPTYNLLDHTENAALESMRSIDGTVQDFQDSIYNALHKVAYNSPGFHVGDKVIPFKKLGAVYQGAKPEMSYLKPLKYSDQFIGRTPQISQRVRSLGVDEYKQFHKEVVDFVKALGITKEERHWLQTAIPQELPMPNAKMQAAADFIKRANQEMFQKEVDMGARSPNDLQAPNYVYNFFKGSDVRDKIATVKADAQAYLKHSSNPLHKQDPAIMQKAIDAHLHPEKDAFRALLYRKLNSNKKLTKAWFKRDLIHNYGRLADNLSPELARKMNLVEQYKNTHLPKDIKAELDRLGSGHAWYLPKDIHQVYETFRDMSSGNEPGHLQGMMRLFDKFTRIFKTSATVPWTGFHVRNMIGDMYMSYIDGVRAKDLSFLTNFARRAKADPNATINIGGKPFTFHELENIFEKNASSGGYQGVELLGAGGGTALHPGMPLNLARKASEKREDLGRFNHFLHAFREEYPAALKTTKDPERALRRAIDASTYRVNKYLFDYAALTNVEQKAFRRVFPFYTYTRKAIPTLMEALYLHPSQFSKTQRLFLEQHDQGSYNDMLTPQYQRDAGYARLSPPGQTHDPWTLAGNFLPTDVLNRNTNFSSPVAFFQNLTSQVNPYQKAPFEIAGKTQYFNDQPIQSTSEYLTNSFLPPVKPIKDLLGMGSKSGWLERLGSGRIGLGLPLDKVSQSEQTAAAMNLKAQVEAKFTEVNKTLTKHGYKLYGSYRNDGSTFRIKNNNTGEIVYETQDPNLAMSEAKKLTK